jgi:hypothetical protein
MRDNQRPLLSTIEGIEHATIRQVLPADGWFAAYRDADAPGGIAFWRVACWALVEEDDDGQMWQRMVGLTVGASGWMSDDDARDFLSYVDAVAREYPPSWLLRLRDSAPS